MQTNRSSFGAPILINLCITRKMAAKAIKIENPPYAFAGLFYQLFTLL